MKNRLDGGDTSQASLTLAIEEIIDYRRRGLRRGRRKGGQNEKTT